MKQIDDTFVSHIDNILNHEHGTELEAKQPKENGPAQERVEHVSSVLF